MDINKIEVFLRAIELGSLSKAAEEYLYTPSAVSHIADTIEDEIGAKIIKRTHIGVEVEEDYKEIIENLKQLVSTQRRIKEIAAAKNKGKNIIKIGTYASVSKYILPPIIKGFKEKFPDTDINIIVDDRLKEGYENNNADIFFGEKFECNDIVWEELMTDPFVAVLPTSYNFSGKSIRREELCKTTFIMIKDTVVNNYMHESVMGDVIKINSHDDSSVIQMVKEGMGTAILPSLSVGNNKEVVSAQLKPKLNRVLGLMYNKKDFNKNKCMRNFIEYIRLFNFYR